MSRTGLVYEMVGAKAICMIAPLNVLAVVYEMVDGAGSGPEGRAPGAEPAGRWRSRCFPPRSAALWGARPAAMVRRWAEWDGKNGAWLFGG